MAHLQWTVQIPKLQPLLAACFLCLFLSPFIAAKFAFICGGRVAATTTAYYCLARARVRARTT
jgi:hypothetical protein